MIRCGSKNNYKKETCLKEIVIQNQSIINILDLGVKITRINYMIF